MFAEALKARLAGIVEIAAEQIRTLEAHYELMVRWNRTVNLTTVIGLEEAVERHYCESLFLASHLPAGSLRIADVGAGAGFPGFPVAVLRAECSVTLIESHQRKAVFLKEASRKMANVSVLARRASDVEGDFDRVVSRAVSYEDLTAALQKLAPNADLLTGGEEPPERMGFEWEKPILLPWGTGRFLRVGRRR